MCMYILLIKKKMSNSSILLIKHLICDTSDNVSFISLRHPGTNESAIFLLTSEKKYLQEVLTFSEPRKSWFINNHIKNSGDFLVSTPIDVLFLVLPYIAKNCSSRAISIEDALIDDEFKDIKILCDMCLQHLHFIADEINVNNIHAFKYNEEKTLKWLKKKINLLVEALKAKNIQVTSTATSVNFSKVSDDSNDIDYIKFAHGIISEYLSEDLSKKLAKLLNLPEDVLAPHKRKYSEIEAVSPNSNLSPGSTGKAKVKQPKISAKSKQLAKAASGTKSISSFFAKK